MNRPMPKTRRQWPWLVLLVAAAAGGVAWLQFGRPGPATPAPSAAAPAPVADTADEAPPPSYPIEQVPVPEAVATLPPPPPLFDSDPAFLEAIAGLLDGASPASHLLAQNVVERLVATIDNLPRREMTPQVLVLRKQPGELATATGDDGALRLDEANYARYDTRIALAEAVDLEAAVALYVHWYPRFQQAYRNLGYPDRQFNDRLVQVIDHLLAAPEVEGPIRLVPDKGRLVFADPALEQLSVGHKAMLRIGPAHAATLKQRLRALRARVAGAAPDNQPARAVDPAAPGG